MSCVVYAFSDKKVAAQVAPIAEQKIDEQKITALIEGNTRLSVVNIQSSPVSGLAEVLTDQGLFYATNDGANFIAGKVYGSSQGMGLVDLSEERLMDVRIAGIKKFDKNMIIYPAKNEKHVITVFTDITCGYCVRMHAQIAEYNDLGITVRYLAYPRDGGKDETGAMSAGAKNLRSIWCNEDPAKALTKVKAGGSVAYRVCDAPIDDEFNFGRQIGVNGTPAIIFENGTLLPGYREPKDLAHTLANM